MPMDSYKPRSYTAIIPDEYDEIAGALDEHDEGGNFLVKGIHVEDGISYDPFGHFNFYGENAKLRPTAIDKKILELVGTPTWPLNWDKNHHGWYGFELQSNDKTGGIGIDILDVLGFEFFGSIRGSSGKEFTKGVTVHSSAGKWCEELVLKYDHDYCDIGLHAKADEGNNSLDRSEIRIYGSCRNEGDIGVSFESTMAHVNAGSIWTHHVLHGQIATAFKLAGGLGPCFTRIHGEAFDVTHTDRNILDITGATIPASTIRVGDAGNSAASFTKRIKGNVMAYDVRMIGAPTGAISGSLQAGGIDLDSLRGIRNSSWTNLVPEDHMGIGVGDRVQAGENMWDGPRTAFCYQNADGKFYKLDANAIATMPCVGVFVQAANLDGYGYLMSEGTVRDENWALNVGGAAGRVWASGTPGSITQEMPVASGDVQQILGCAIKPTVVKVIPSLIYTVVP